MNTHQPAAHSGEDLYRRSASGGKRRHRLMLAGTVAVAAAAATAMVLSGAAAMPAQSLVAAAPSAVSGVVNTYQAVRSVAGTTVVVTGSTRGTARSFAVGDSVMLIQMTGVSPAVSGSDMGNYEVTTITAVQGDRITLAAVARDYSPATEAVQLVRMADTMAATVSSTITAAAWNGTTGGVVAMTGESLQLNGDIDVSATGFSNTHRPTESSSASLSTGLGSSVGRGNPGGTYRGGDGATSVAGGAGGGIGGGGGTTGTELNGTGGGRAGGGGSGSGGATAGTNGGAAGPGFTATWQLGGVTGGGSGGAAGGGGGVIGGGGGGGSLTSGGGGGTDGGGGGGEYDKPFLAELELHWAGGGGGTLGVGNGGDGLIGGVSGASTTGSANEGSAGGGGGSYGGGGGAPSNFSGGDDSSGGGGGGSWTGGGAGGKGGTSYSYPSGGDGNAALSQPLPDSAHFLNSSDPRLMMGGAGGRGSQESGHSAGGVGGGIVYLDYSTIGGSGDVRSDGGAGAEPAGGGAHSGSGGGAGGQMRIRASELTSPMTFAVNGGVGGTPTSNLYHSGVAGGGGGAGGVWVELARAEASCPATDVPEIVFELAGGNGGPSVSNPKNSWPTGTGGAGGRGLGCVSPLAESGAIKLSKKIVDPAPGDTYGDAATFPVEVECTTPGEEPVTRVVLLDRDGTTVLLKGLDVGAVCSLTETDTDGGEARFEPEGPISVAAAEPVAVVLTNTFPATTPGSPAPTTPVGTSPTAPVSTSPSAGEPSTSSPGKPSDSTTDWPADDAGETVTGSPVAQLPDTGASGSAWGLAVGGALTLLGGLVLTVVLTRRRDGAH